MEKDLKPPPPPPPLPPPSPKPEPDPPFSNDISRMPDFPPRATAHRRAHSEILSLPDDLSFDTDLGVVPDANGVGPSLSDEAPDDDLLSIYLDFDKSAPSSSASTAPSPPHAAAESNERPSRPRHHHSQSMDGSSSSSSVKVELPGGGGDGGTGTSPSLAETKKAMSAAKLADLALVDPKRAKRIWANRQSAARSKERKMRYIAELERKVQTLQTEATTLSAQLTMLQRDTSGLTAENSELKLRLQTMEQQVHLQDALNDALREEVQRLKLMTGQVLANGGQMMNYGSASFGGNQQFYPQNHTMQSMLAAHQLQQLHLHSHQQQMHPNQLQHQQQQQMVPHMPSELKSKAPMISANQSQRDGAFEANHPLAKD